jgi:uncharacterized protein (DUF1697 family)
MLDAPPALPPARLHPLPRSAARRLRADPPPVPLALRLPRFDRGGQDAATWVVLLRGVGSVTQVPPRLLRAALASQGLDRVVVRGQTGNAVLRSALPEAEVEARAARACERELGFRKGVHLRRGTDWMAMVADNPFPGAALADPGALHVALLADDLDPRRLAVSGWTPDRAVQGDRCLYLCLPPGRSRQRLLDRARRGLPAVVTTRSWATILKIHALVEAAEAEGAALRAALPAPA